MQERNNPTQNEHFIPVMYLKNFSRTKYKKANKEKNLIWQYDLNSMKQIPDPVDVRDICFEENLYEIKDRDGSFIDQNLIEKTFKRFEDNAGRVIQEIIAKAQNENCLKCSTVLSEDDKTYLLIFLTALAFRDPQTIDSGIAFLQASNPEIDIREARNFTLWNMLPLSNDAEWNNNTIIRSALSMFCGMAFQIGMADSDIVITSDRPVIIWRSYDTEPNSRPRAVAFPLTSNLVLFLYPIESVDPMSGNCFFRMSDQQIKDIQANVAVYARRWIYSKDKLTDEQLETVRKTRERMQEKS